MKQEIDELKQKFEEVKQKGWIKAPNNQKNSNGILFEQLIGKPIEQFELPDFKGIEIKTHDTMSQSSITLFSAVPDGPSFFETERLCQLYGYPDKDLPEYPVLFGDVKVTYRQQIGRNYFYQLRVDRNQKLVLLLIFDRQGICIDRKTFWTFQLLEEKLMRKLQYLAYISIKRKQIELDFYFYYEKIRFYQLRDFDTFINLLETGIIQVSFAVGVFKSGKRKGQIHNHGVLFRMKENHLLDLFDLIENMG